MSTIEWTDKTVNPIRARNMLTGRTGWHCEHVSEGCRNCYAEKRNLSPMFGKTFAGTKQAYKPLYLQSGVVEVFLADDVLKKVMGMKKAQRVFWASMTDIFGHWVTDAMLDQCFVVMAMTPHLTHILLTKRPERAREYLGSNNERTPIIGISKAGRAMNPDKWPIVLKWPLPNVQLGVSVSTQAAADKFVPYLLDTPAAVRIVSYEPAIEVVDFTRIKLTGEEENVPECGINALTGDGYPHGWQAPDQVIPSLDQIIMGGESGPGARPMHPDWARSVRDQCVEEGVAFFFKQWGEWEPQYYAGEDGEAVLKLAEPKEPIIEHNGSRVNMRRVSKKAAGRYLDGRTWDAMPGEAGRGEE